MVVKVLDGVTHDFDDLNANDNRGYADLITPGSGGDPVPRYIAIMLDALADMTKNLVTTSTSTESISSGSKTLTMVTVVPLQAGMYIMVADSANPTTKWMLGQITSVSSSVITFNVENSDYYEGSGSVSSWNISVSAPLGPQGATGEISLDEFQKNSDKSGTTTGSGGAYVLNPTNAYGAMVALHSVKIIPNHTNTGAATLDLSGQGADNIYWNGQALKGGEIQANIPLELVHDGTRWNITSQIAPLVPITFNKGPLLQTNQGDDWDYFDVPSELAGYSIVAADATVKTAGTTNTLDIQVHNEGLSLDVFSTKLQIDSAATRDDKNYVINTSNDLLAEDDRLRVDIDAVHSTAAKGLTVRLWCRRI